MAKRSIERVAKKAMALDAKARAALTKKVLGAKRGATPIADAKFDGLTMDSFVNYQMNMGVGAQNPLSSASYGFNPITRIRTLLEWIHRGSWLGGQAVDVIAEDMTRMGIELSGDMKPEDMEKIEEAAVVTGIWKGIKECIQWGRLYGGCIAVMMIDGQDWSTPLRLDRIGKGQFKGLLVLDRWMVDPTLFDLVTEAGPEIGMPKYYTVVADAPALPRVKIHYSRVMRQVGVELPYWQKVMENLWGESILERLYDRMIAFDSASTGAAQLVYKSYIRTYKVKDLRSIATQGGKAFNALQLYVDILRRFQNLEGISLMDSEDEFEGNTSGGQGITGMANVLDQFAQQLSGALGIPLVRLFGQSPTGFNSGDTDIRLYYDSIKQRQESTLRIPVTRIYRALAQSEGIEFKEGTSIQFRNLWQLTEDQKADVATKITQAVTQAHEAGLVSDQAAMKELKQSSHETGIFTNISDEDIDAADDEPIPAAEAAMQQTAELGLGPKAPGEEGEEESGKPAAKPGKGAEEKPAKKTAKDTMQSVSRAERLFGLQVVIENPKDSHRTGFNWEAILAGDYGYIRNTVGADGDPLDCFVGTGDQIFIIDQIRKRDDGKPQFDEHKIMLGYLGMQAALSDYLRSYTDNAWERLGAITRVTAGELEDWIKGADLSLPYRRR